MKLYTADAILKVVLLLGPVGRVDAVGFRELLRVCSIGGRSGIGAALELMRRHHAKELTCLLCADRLASPMPAMHYLHRPLHVRRMQPDCFWCQLQRVQIP